MGRALPIYGHMAEISSMYNIDGFKPILAVKGGNVAVLSNVCMKAKVSLYHQKSVQCWVNLFLAAF